MNCDLVISNKFIFAIKSNICPACGENIRDLRKLKEFDLLTNLLIDTFAKHEKEMHPEDIALLVLSNFDVKEFKDTMLPATKEADIVVSEDDPDAEHKLRQMAEAKDILQKLRDEALSDATADHWGLGDANGLVGDNAYDMVRNAKRAKSQEAVTKGGGSFTRG